MTVPATKTVPPGSAGDRRSSARHAQTLSDADQTVADADQTHADLDQTAADADQSASERDQAASDRDQEAADLDQSESDRADDDGTSSSHAAQTRRIRAQTGLERDLATQIRTESAQLRDATADRRDRDADARDDAAAARDVLAIRLEHEICLEEATESAGAPHRGLLGRFQTGRDSERDRDRERGRAVTSRARAAAQRDHAARDRARAREDRAQAAADRCEANAELALEGVDHLTGAMRRRVGLAAMQREIARLRRTPDRLVIAFVDVDGLKVLNDTHGHQAGDDVLRGVVRCIQDSLRPYDVVMRYGGDEFVCSLTGQELAGARSRFDQICASIAEGHDGATITVGLVEGGANDSLDELIAHADLQVNASRKRR